MSAASAFASGAIFGILLTAVVAVLIVRNREQ